jgi:hypothetical protein
MEWRQAKRRAAEAWQRRTDPEQWRRDSIERAATESSFARLPRPNMPREVARRQLFADCAVGFEVRDSVFRVAHFELRAALWQTGAHAVTKASTYRPEGFGVGDTIWVVVKEMNCSDLASGGLALSPVGGEGLSDQAR